MTITNTSIFAATVTGFFTILIMAIGLVALTLFFNHRRRMALIEAEAYDYLNTGFGSLFEFDDENWSPRHTLAVGLLTTAIGLGLSAESHISGTPYQGSLIILSVGLALLAYYDKTSDD